MLNEREERISETHILRQDCESYKFMDEIGAAQSLRTEKRTGLEIEIFLHHRTAVLLPHPFQFGKIFLGHHTTALMGTTLAGGGVTMSRSLLAQRSNASRFSASYRWTS